MSIAIRLYVADDEGFPPRPQPETEYEYASPNDRPVPLVHRDIIQQTPDGPRMDSIILWRNEDGMRCEFCPGECTFSPGPEGQGFCVIRRTARSTFLGLPG